MKRQRPQNRIAGAKRSRIHVPQWQVNRGQVVECQDAPNAQRKQQRCVQRADAGKDDRNIHSGARELYRLSAAIGGSTVRDIMSELNARSRFVPLVIAVVAALLYVPGLSDAPIYLAQDEVIFAVNARAIATTGKDLYSDRVL